MQVGSAWGFLLPVLRKTERKKRGNDDLFREIGSRDDVKDNAEDGEQQSKEAQRLGSSTHYVEAEQAQRCKCNDCKNDLLNEISDFVTHFDFSFIINLLLIAYQLLIKYYYAAE